MSDGVDHFSGGFERYANLGRNAAAFPPLSLALMGLGAGRLATSQQVKRWLILSGHLAGVYNSWAVKLVLELRSLFEWRIRQSFVGDRGERGNPLRYRGRGAGLCVCGKSRSRLVICDKVPFSNRSGRLGWSLQGHLASGGKTMRDPWSCVVCSRCSTGLRPCHFLCCSACPPLKLTRRFGDTCGRRCGAPSNATRSNITFRR